MPQGNKTIFIFGCGTIGACVLDCLVFGKGLFKKAQLDITDYNICIVDRLFRKEVTDFYDKLGDAKRPTFITTSFSKAKLKDNLDHINICDSDIILDLTSGTGTKDFIKEICIRRGARYLCTATEGWGGYISEMDEAVREIGTLKKRLGAGSPTALLTHGMNPGLVSHFAMDLLDSFTDAEKRALKTIHITEIDTQRFTNKKEAPKMSVPKLISTLPNMGSFVVSTWGPQNFADEMCARPRYVQNGRVVSGKRRAYRSLEQSFIYDPDIKEVRPFVGCKVTHEEAFTMFYHLKRLNYHKGTSIAFVYQPTSESLESLLSQQRGIKRYSRKGMLLRGKSLVGHDTVGIYIKSDTGREAWMGNTCHAGFAPIAELKPRYHNATTYQVAAGVLSGLAYLLKHPKMGLTWPEEVSSQHRQDLLSFASKWMGRIMQFI